MSRRSLVLAVVVAVALSACTASGTLLVSATPVVYQEPPQPQDEQVTPRPGFLWIKGRWDWKNNQWTWVGGRWDRERSGYAWQEGRWERRGSAYHWVEGQWGPGEAREVDEVGDGPTEQPPDPKFETSGPARDGHIWVSGHWRWNHGHWDWIAGRWERERANRVWNPGRWENRGTRWRWIDGRWSAVQDHGD